MKKQDTTASLATAMPSSPEAIARSLGLVNPTIKPFILKVGNWFTVKGTAPNGRSYDFRYEVIDLDDTQVSFKFDGVDSGRNKYRNNVYRIKILLSPNMLQYLDNPVGANLWIAFISSSPAKFSPKPGGSVTVAFGVRDTVPPPPPKG